MCKQIICDNQTKSRQKKKEKVKTKEKNTASFITSC